MFSLNKEEKSRHSISDKEPEFLEQLKRRKEHFNKKLFLFFYYTKEIRKKEWRTDILYFNFVKCFQLEQNFKDYFLSLLFAVWISVLLLILWRLLPSANTHFLVNKQQPFIKKRISYLEGTHKDCQVQLLLSHLCFWYLVHFNHIEQGHLFYVCPPCLEKLYLV